MTENGNASAVVLDAQADNGLFVTHMEQVNRDILEFINS
jgi:hypothetical protein